MPAMKVFISFVIFFLIFHPHLQRVYAVTTTITQPPAFISSTSFTLSLSITGAKVGKNYLRVDIFKQGTSEYFGETFNGQEWYGSDDGTKYAPIDITSADTQLATISARLSTFAPSWTSHDSYMLRVRRYTSSGSYTSAEAEASAIPITIVFPTPSPSPIPSPTIQSPTSSPVSSPTQIPTQSQQPATTNTDNIFISEALTNPLSGHHEWVELFNNNDYTVVLDSWFIDDIENGGSSPQVFTLTLNPRSFGVIDLQSALFNNSGDTVRLLDSEKVQKDYFSYTQIEQGMSFSRYKFDSHDVCATLPSKNLANTTCKDTYQESTTTTTLPLEENSAENIEDNVLGETLQNQHNMQHTFTPDTSSITGFQAIGHEPSNLQPPEYHDYPVHTTQLPASLFSRPLITNLIKTGAASSGGISLLNIVYILYRIKIWLPHSRLRIASFIGSP